MKNLVILLSAVVLFVGCTTGESKIPCQEGTLHFINNSVNPYKIEIDNKPSTDIAKFSTLDQTVFNGSYYVKCTQISGYKVNPVVKEYHVTVDCDVITISIPLSPHDSI